MRGCRPVERGQLVYAFGKCRSRVAERYEELFQYVFHRRRLLADSAQVDEQLPVRKPGLDPVRNVHCQRGLAQPAGTGDRRQRRTWSRPDQVAGELRGIDGAAAEVGYRGR